jgi:myo-inositol-1(or 4)-monophosphatase
LPDADDLALLSAAAHRAGDIALGYFRRDPKVWQKANASPVSEADLAVDRHLRETLLEARPDYGWLSEETEDNAGRLAAKRLFVVDPIDGTRGFLAGADDWTVSLAIVEAGRPTVAVLYQPVADRLHAARASGGAILDGRPLRVRDDASPREARVAGPAGLITRLRAAEPSLRPGGFIASLALRIAMVADGRLDIALAKAHAHDWDIAAADLILAEAGGTLTGVGGEAIVYNRPSAEHPALIGTRRGLGTWVTDHLRPAR